MRRILIVAVAMLGVTCLAYANLLTNGDFESGNSGFASGYTYSPGDITPAGVYDVLNDPSSAHPSAASFGDHTTGSGLMMAINGATNSSTDVWTQTVAVTPNTVYVFSGWVATWYTDGFAGDLASLDLIIWTSDYGTQSIGTHQAPGTAGVWDQFSATWNSGTATSASVEIYDPNNNFAGNDFALDDLSFVVIPEPSTMVLLGSGLLLGLLGGYRRRQRARKTTTG